MDHSYIRGVDGDERVATSGSCRMIQLIGLVANSRCTDRLADFGFSTAHGFSRINRVAISFLNLRNGLSQALTVLQVKGDKLDQEPFKRGMIRDSDFARR